MTRARATALALVNWKGVFYERYLLDRHVTVLEGANGAGKTTVMIAAYVALLPDMSRLRFTNLGESGATGGDRGIWGRLGEEGRPSYTALEIETGDQRVVAGVRLERKAEPTIELTPFLVSGVNLEGRLKEILLASEDDSDTVPSITELRDAVVKRGGELTVFASAKEYFAALFDRGIFPLRLAAEEERSKLNDMLRTSMTGGISRALTTELRSFLLKEDTGLGDTLSRMRANLDACHRTRTEVVESQSLERSLSSVFEVGQGMFTASMLATRGAASELAAHADAARERRDRSGRDLRELERSLAEVTERHEQTRSRSAEIAAARDAAHGRKEQVARAVDTHTKLTKCEADLETAKKRLEQTTLAREETAAERKARAGARDRAREAYDRAAYGVGDLQAGLEELHRNVNARRRAMRRLSEVREALPDFELAKVERIAGETRSRLVEVDLERARLSRASSSSVERRNKFDLAFTALLRIAPDATRDHAHEYARAAEIRFLELDERAKHIAALSASIARESELAARQGVVRSRAEACGLELGERASRSVSEALDAADADLRRAEIEAREVEEAMAVTRREEAESRTRIARLEESRTRWISCRAVAAELEATLAMPVRTRADALVGRTRIAELREQARARITELRAAQEQRLREASELEAAGGAFHPDLIRIRDELDAELLAGRFEDLDPAFAAEVEAELGPLANALIVDDPASAAKLLANSPREIADLWLIRPDAALLQRARRAPGLGADLVVEEAYGVRLTRRPERPSIGKLARERRAKELREEAAQLALAIEEALQKNYALDASNERADLLVANAELLERADLEGTLAEERETHEAHTRRAETFAAEIEASGARIAGMRARISTLRALLGDAFLLDPPDHAEELRSLELRLEAARAAKEELRRIADDRRVLSEIGDELRSPPHEGDVAELAAKQVSLDAERDRLFQLTEALEELTLATEVLRADHIERALEEKTSIAPALQAQLDAARSSLAEHETQLGLAEKAAEEASAQWQTAQASFSATNERVFELREELSSLGFSELTADALTVAEGVLRSCEADRIGAEAAERSAAAELARLKERRVQLERAARETEGQLADKEKEARPAHTAWAELEAKASEQRLMSRSLLDRMAEDSSTFSSARAASEARSQAQLLLERLRRAAGGTDCVTEVETALSGGTYLETWLIVREWIKKRMPGQLAESDVMDGLSRLRENLSLLERRLSRQETDLRGASEDVARGIDVRLRRAKAQVRRLNQSLQNVRFGSIAAIRVEMKRVERMDAVLKALREGAAQELLFQSNLPIEAALDEIFKRFGGGRTGGQRILDYREYAELAVEIQRQSSDDNAWEAASPTRLSTGEAIGVGAALMMVVLTEWERDGNLLRSHATPGSLRFLFLDEANRLSQDNLGVLFSLCENLDLQLLIAAPEVARADGNTTYRLVRRTNADGSEEVIVSGRRTVAVVDPESQPEPVVVAEPVVAEPVVAESPPEGQLDWFAGDTPAPADPSDPEA